MSEFRTNEWSSTRSYSKIKFNLTIEKYSSFLQNIFGLVNLEVEIYCYKMQLNAGIYHNIVLLGFSIVCANLHCNQSLPNSLNSVTNMKKMDMHSAIYITIFPDGSMPLVYVHDSNQLDFLQVAYRIVQCRLQHWTQLLLLICL